MTTLETKQRATKWNAHPTYSNYEATRKGEIRHKKNGKIQMNIGGGGYYMFNACKDGEWRSQYTHRFVYECFNGLIPNDRKMVTDHIDENKLNNNLKNLRITTNAKNIQKSKDARTTKATKKAVEGHNEDTDKNQTFKSMGEAGRIIGVNGKTISQACDGIQKCVKSKVDGSKWTFKYIVE